MARLTDVNSGVASPVWDVVEGDCGSGRAAVGIVDVGFLLVLVHGISLLKKKLGERTCRDCGDDDIEILRLPVARREHAQHGGSSDD